MTLRNIINEKEQALSETATLYDAKKMILNNRSAAVIVRDNKPIGILTRRDHIGLILQGIPLESLAIHYAKTEIIRVRIDRSLDYALRVMADYGVRRVVVIDDAGLFVCVISYDMIIQALQEASHNDDVRVGELITEKNALFLPPDQTLGYAAGMMLGAHVATTIVIDEHKHPLGVITESHILQAEENATYLTYSLDSLMQSPAITIKAHDTIDSVTSLMKMKNVHSVVVVDEDNRALGALTSTDILRRLHTPYYGMLESKMAMIKETLDKLPYAVIELQQENNKLFVYWANRQAYRFFPHLTPEVDMIAILPHEVTQAIEQLITTQSLEAKKILCAEGFVFEFSFFTHSHDRWQVVLNDISELNLLHHEIEVLQEQTQKDRQKAFEALRNSSAILFSVLNSIEAFIYVIDIESFHVVFQNKKAHKTFGSGIGQPCFTIFQQGMEGPCSFCPIVGYIRNGLVHEGMGFEWEHTNTITGRDYYYYERVIRWIDGKLVKIQVGLDITEHKRIEKMLHDVNTNLEERVAYEIEKNRQKELVLAKQSRLAAMGEMINAIAHQWRQPLNSLAISVQDLPDAYDYGELNREYLDKAVEKAMRTISYMSQTIDDFRNFFKPHKEAKEFSFHEAVSNVLNLLDAQLKSHGISVTLDLHDTSPLLGFKNEFEQVLLNLINNARDALDENKQRQKIITLHSHETPEACILTVSDNAGGISQEIIERIFEPYFTTKETNKGTGLGLYLAKMIIEENMHGTIDVTNESQGAQFTITLPKILLKDM